MLYSDYLEVLLKFLEEAFLCIYKIGMMQFSSYIIPTL